MARPERVEYVGAYYHVMDSGRGRQQVFHDVKYYEYFLSCLEQAHKRFGLETHAYSDSGVTRAVTRLTQRMAEAHQG